MFDLLAYPLLIYQNLMLMRNFLVKEVLRSFNKQKGVIKNHCLIEGL